VGENRGVGFAVMLVDEAVHLVGHGVGGAEDGIGKGQPGGEARHGHVGVGLHVVPVGHRLAQVAGDQLDRLEGVNVGQRGGRQRHVGLDAVGEGIQSGGGGQLHVHGLHQFRIDNGDVRHQRLGDDRHLQFAGRVDDDGELAHLRAGAGGGRGDHHGGEGEPDLVDPLVARMATALATSVGLPPPTATMPSHPDA